MCGKQLKYIRNGFNTWEMALLFEKRLEYVGNHLDMWEMAKIYDLKICLKYSLDVW